MRRRPTRRRRAQRRRRAGARERGAGPVARRRRAAPASSRARQIEALESGRLRRAAERHVRCAASCATTRGCWSSTPSRCCGAWPARVAAPDARRHRGAPRRTVPLPIPTATRRINRASRLALSLVRARDRLRRDVRVALRSRAPRRVASRGARGRSVRRRRAPEPRGRAGRRAGSAAAERRSSRRRRGAAPSRDRAEAQPRPQRRPRRQPPSRAEAARRPRDAAAPRARTHRRCASRASRGSRSATRDGKVLLSQLNPAGQRADGRRASRRSTLVVGNAPDVQLSYNDRAVRPRAAHQGRRRALHARVSRHDPHDACSRAGAWSATIAIGGGAPIVVQSMTNTDTEDAAATARQVAALARAGSEIVRITVNTPEAAAQVAAHPRRGSTRMGCDVPLVGDFHFNGHKLLTQYPGVRGGARQVPHQSRQRRPRREARRAVRDHDRERRASTASRCASASTGAASIRSCSRA